MFTMSHVVYRWYLYPYPYVLSFQGHPSRSVASIGTNSFFGKRWSLKFNFIKIN